ncbi:MAG: anthranilate synthase component I [Gemmatimonadota bacterium]|jgi:anthranilate synthase component 1|nr:anthranilate synthase component I [Gemmatimonadota bacterium]
MTSFDDFRALARSSTLVPVYRDLLFDTDTAVSAYAKIARPPFGFLLESVVGGETWARYTFLGTEPRAAWRLVRDRIDRWSPEEGWVEGESVADPLADLDAIMSRYQPAEVPGLPRFWGGAVGFFGYDIIRHIERLPDSPPDTLGLPDALFMLTDGMVAIDNLFGRAKVIVGVEVEGADEAELRRRYDAALARINVLVDRLREGDPLPALDPAPAPEGDPPFTSSVTREEYENGVRRVQEYIAAGDIFQAVLSQRLSVPISAPPFDLYRVLRALNPSPYLFYLDLDGFQLVGSSPEVLVRVDEGKVVVRPIAGTRRRGGSAAEDVELSSDMLADPKERAEHLMLLDLGRNDVGRVSRYGSVRVPERMIVERYSHVLHMVSTVEGDLREGVSAMDVLRASFPAGTVSGAPKVRAMEIIDELEAVRRGPYAGAVGYIANGGQAMDLAIAIRTMIIANGQAHVQAGAGIVADSDPASEYEETLNKARGPLRAVRILSAQKD